MHISLMAMQMLDLDCIWWLVTPQNPLKTDAPLSMPRRIEQCEEIAAHPKILVSGLEQDTGTHITIDTIRALKRYYSKTDFVWITGMDNALSLHQWNDWKTLLELISMAHLTRMPATSLVQNSPLRLYEKQRHTVLMQAAKPDLGPGRTFWILGKKMINISSTQLRNQSKSNT